MAKSNIVGIGSHNVAFEGSAKNVLGGSVSHSQLYSKSCDLQIIRAGVDASSHLGRVWTDLETYKSFRVSMLVRSFKEKSTKTE